MEKSALVTARARIGSESRAVCTAAVRHRSCTTARRLDAAASSRVERSAVGIALRLKATARRRAEGVIGAAPSAGSGDLCCSMLRFLSESSADRTVHWISDRMNLPHAFPSQAAARTSPRAWIDVNTSTPCARPLKGYLVYSVAKPACARPPRLPDLHPRAVNAVAPGASPPDDGISIRDREASWRTPLGRMGSAEDMLSSAVPAVAPFVPDNAAVARSVGVPVMQDLARAVYEAAKLAKRLRGSRRRSATSAD